MWKTLGVYKLSRNVGDSELMYDDERLPNLVCPICKKQLQDCIHLTKFLVEKNE